MGNLTRDPEVRYTPKGNAVTDLGLAVNRNYTLDSGERREEVTFVDITVWGRQAELAGQYLHKGRPVFIEGRLQLDSWEDKNTGEKRNKLRVVCENMRFIGGRGDSQGGGYSESEQDGGSGNGDGDGHGAGPGGAARSGVTDDGPAAVDFDEEDDIPF